MYQKVSTDLKILLTVRRKTEKFLGREWYLPEKYGKIEKKGRHIHFTMDLRLPMENRTSDSADSCHQGYDSKIPYHERIYGTKKSRVGYTRTSGGTGSGKIAWTWMEKSRLRNMD